MDIFAPPLSGGSNLWLSPILVCKIIVLEAVFCVIMAGAFRLAGFVMALTSAVITLMKRIAVKNPISYVGNAVLFVTLTP